jgi:hypothetical protein
MELVAVLRAQVQRDAARHEQRQARRSSEQWDKLRAGTDEMLEVVEHDQLFSRRGQAAQRVGGWLARVGAAT